MKKVLTLFCIIFFLISCKEESEDNTGTYVSQNIEIGTIKLYSKSGEIKDSKTIYNYINTHDKERHFFIQNVDSTINVKNLCAIEILPKNVAKLINFRDSTIYTIKNQNQILYLESKDTSYDRHDEITPFYAKMFMYNPLYSKTSYTPYSNGYNQITKFRNCKYLFLSKNRITYPLLTYNYFQSYQDGLSYRSETCSNINNIFNEESTKLLNATDTIAIQQINLILTK